MLRRRQLATAAAAFAIGGASGRAVAQASRKVLRVVPQAEPQVFDPHQSQANVTSVHVAMVYDTLFSWDADMVPRPQMVETWTKSEDRLFYTFTLRPGLRFHDGSPVTTRDVIATLRRPVADTSDALFEQHVALNIHPVFEACPAAVQQFRAQGGGGAIVNLSSVAARTAAAGLGPLCRQQGLRGDALPRTREGSRG